jgi:hypothetical protein
MPNTAFHHFQSFQTFHKQDSEWIYNLFQASILTEQQFAQVLGRAKLYNAMPKNMKKDIPPLSLSDSQLGSIAEDFYQDKSHCRNNDGSISLWNIYNLFTGANKSSYIDTFLDRNVLAHQSAFHLFQAVNGKDSWYLN